MSVVKTSFELSTDFFSSVLFRPLHGSLGFITIYQSANVKFFELPQCFTFQIILSFYDILCSTFLYPITVIAIKLTVYQVIPDHENPQKRRTMFGGYSNIVAFSTKLFTRHVRRHPSKKINTKKLPEKLLDASESYKTSANLSIRAYFRQFSDW